MLKAVIFDLDGLLVDSTPVQQEAMQRFVESFGKIYLKPKAHDEGMRIIDIIREYKDIFDLPGSVEELYHKRQAIFFELVQTQLALFPGALPLLEKLRSRNLKLAIATSGDRDYLRLIMQKFPELQQYFSVVITSEDVRRGKPYPDVYEKTLVQLGVAPNEAVILEDSVNGIIAGKRANIQVICVPNRHYPDADYALADRVFESLIEVAQTIA